MPELKKRNLLEDIESRIATARATPGIRDPLDFIRQVASKVAVTPRDLYNISDLVDLATSRTRVADRAMMLDALSKVRIKPGNIVKQLASNPPNPSTIAAMGVPAGILTGYRHTVPLKARAYLHHLSGVDTPFTKVTKKERAQMVKDAQKRIDTYLEDRAYFEKRLAEELEESVLDVGLQETSNIGLHSKKSHRLKPTIMKETSTPAAENVKKMWKELTGRRLEGFYTDPNVIHYELDPVNTTNITVDTFGKHFINPTMREGKIVPKSISDVYYFPKGVDRTVDEKGIKEFFKYRFGKIKKRIDEEDLDKSVKRQLFMRSLMRELNPVSSEDAHTTLGYLSRKLAFSRKPTIVDIPLLEEKARKLNAFDRAALLSAIQSAKEK